MSDSPNGLPALTSDLMARAVCNTSHPADAARALLLAAGMVLDARFGATGALVMMRSILDDTEAAMVARHGPQLGETVQ
jgi:hypothetical protein